jgi:ubiquinone biosynthesis protein UbiJ
MVAKKRPLCGRFFTRFNRRTIHPLNYVLNQTFSAGAHVTIALPSLPTRFALHPVRLWANAFNLLTRQQPWAAQRLAAYAGQTLKMCLGGFQLTFTIEHDGTLVAADSAVVPDVVLELIAEKLSWADLLAPGARTDIAQWVHVTGQAALAQVVSDLARDLRPDPEDALAQWLGDIPARRLTQGVKGLVTDAQSFGRSLAENLAEYFSEETNTLAGAPAQAALTHERERTLGHLAHLEQRTAALQARLARLAPHPGARA